MGEGTIPPIIIQLTPFRTEYDIPHGRFEIIISVIRATMVVRDIKKCLFSDILVTVSQNM